MTSCSCLFLFFHSLPPLGFWRVSGKLCSLLVIPEDSSASAISHFSIIDLIPSMDSFLSSSKFVVIFNMVTKLPPPVLFVLNSYDCLLFTLYFSLILGTLKSPFQCITLWKWPSPCGSLILLLVSFPVHFSNYLSANVWDFSFLSVGNIALSNLP